MAYNPQAESVQGGMYMYYNSLVDRFQEYAPNFLQGQEKTNLLDLSSIKGPEITMFVGKRDEFCPYETAIKTK